MCVARSLLDVHSQHMSLVRKGNILAKTTQAVRCATRTLPIPLRCSRIASPHDPASSSLLQVPGPHCALAGHCSSEPLCHVLRAQDTPSTAAVATTAAVCVSRACVCVGVAHELQPKTPRQPKAPRLAPPELPPSAEPLLAPSSKRAGKRATQRCTWRSTTVAGARCAWASSMAFVAQACGALHTYRRSSTHCMSMMYSAWTTCSARIAGFLTACRSTMA